MPKISYQVHIQSIGWQSVMAEGKTAGTTGRVLRLEGVKINLDGVPESLGSIEYSTHVESIGWQGFVGEGKLSGTTGRSLCLEAVRIRLTGALAEQYDIYYRMHIQDYGWMGWAKNGECAGSAGYAKRMEALENITLYLNKTGEGKPSGKIKYSTHVSKSGWQKATELGTVNGCKDGSAAIEAVKISLSGDIATYYDIYYRAHCQNYGWLGWAKNGQPAGTTTQGYQMEALQIKLVPKEASAPGSNKNYYTEKKFRKYQNPSQYYQIQDSIRLSGGGYTLSKNYMGVKVMKVIQKLGIKGRDGIGMGDALYDGTVIAAVKQFQKKEGLQQTGNVDLTTWLRMGFTKTQWEQWGAYVSPMKVNANSSRAEHIEAMISTAYSYLGTPYVIGASGPPKTGIDCSGLVMQGLYAAGIDLSPINPVRHAKPGYEYESRNLWNSSKLMEVSYNQRQRGDLIFYQNSKEVVIHVAIYVGNNKVIEAWPNKVVEWPIKNAQRSNMKGVRRPFV